MWLLYEALISVYGSARRVEAELAHPRRLEPDPHHHPRALSRTGPTCTFRQRPMRRHHYLYARNRYLTDPTSSPSSRAPPRTRRRPGPRARAPRPRRRRVRGPIPISVACSTPTARSSLPSSRPSPATNASTARPASSSRTRYEPDAALHFEGDGNAAWGTKFVLVAARTDDVHGRIILDVEWVPTPGGEARTRRRLLHPPRAPHAWRTRRHLRHRTTRRPPPAPAARTRAAARSTASPPPRPAPRSPAANDRRVEKNVHIEDKTITLPDGTSRHPPPLRVAVARSASPSSPTPATSLRAARPHPHPPQPRQERPVPLVQRLPAPRPLRPPDHHRPAPRQRRRRRRASSTGPRTSGPSRRATPTSNGCSPAATTPSPSTVTSTTPCGSAVPTASATPASTSISSASPSR